MKPAKSLRARALDIVARQEISRADLKRKLAPHAESEDELERLLDDFAQRHWQSDERFAEAYIHSKGQKHGKLRLQQALHAKGIDSEMAQELMPSAEDELHTAIAVLRKKFKQPAADAKEKQKQFRFLAYRGFDMNTAQAAIKHAWAEIEEDE